jgi:aerobic carbon-monoxide dehydrogenase large subunit
MDDKVRPKGRSSPLQSGKLVGQSVPRKEDLAFLTGTARYIDDLRIPGMLYAKILRSPMAHARVKGIDYSKALEMPGVRGALCARDLIGKVKPWGDMMSDLLVGNLFPFATEKVLYEGQEVAAVVADTKYQALDALDAIRVEYEELPAIIDPEAAIKPDCPIIHEGTNYEFGDGNIFDRYRIRVGDIAAAERDADVVVRQRFTTNKQAGAALDPHGCIADYDSFTGILTLYASTQSLYMMRDALADALQMPRNRIRVVAPDVGAGFGSKAQLLGHDVIASVFSMQLGKPVHCVLGRGEIFRAGTTRNSQVRYAEMFLKNDGTIIGYRDYIVHNCGAVSMLGNQVVQVGTGVGMLPYPIPNIHVDADCVYTNLAPGGALRGFGIPQTLWAKEQLVDMAANALGMDPVDIRARNVINSADCPFRTPMGQIVDTTSVSDCVQKAASAIDWKRLRANRVPFEGVGMAVGMKYTSARHPSFDTDLSAVRLRLETDGTVTIYSSDLNHGQGHATFLSQIVSDVVGAGFEKIRLAAPDTNNSPFGLGTWGSRGAAVLGTACRLAAERLRKKLFQIAAHVLDERLENLEAGGDKIYPRGSPESGLWLENLAGFCAYRTHQLPPDFEPSLEVMATYDTPTDRQAPDGTGNLSMTYSTSVHTAHVRINPGTGRVTILRYVIASDSGTVINPQIVEGQHLGSFLMGLGMATGEDYVYDDNGHLLNGSFKDYLAPLATDVPDHIELYEIPAPSTAIPGGQKGAGETATGPVPPALGNAIAHAIGVRFTELPITADRVLLALREKEARGMEVFRYPDDMPDFKGPRNHDAWPRSRATDEGLFL